MYKSPIDGDKEILKRFLENGKEVRYRNILQGHGLKDSDFDNFKPNCSRRVFNHRKENFINTKLIAPLKHKGKKEQHHAITPLGLAYLFQNSEMDLYQFGKCVEYLTRYVDGGWLPYDEISAQNWYGFDIALVKKLSKDISKKIICQSLKSILEDVKIIKHENKINILLSTKLPRDAICTLSKFTINNDGSILQNFDPKNEYSSSESVDEKSFFSAVARHICLGFHFNLKQTLDKRKVPKYYKEELEDIAVNHGIDVENSTSQSLESVGIDVWGY